MSTTTLTPEVLWAQRSSPDEPSKNIIYLTITAPDVSASALKLTLNPKSIDFAGYSSSKETNYAVTLNLDQEIDPAESKTHHTSRGVEMVLRKKEAKAEFWPRLLEGKKVHFLKTDFDKWVDEDEQDEVADEDPYAAMGGMPGMGGAGMPGMGGDGGLGGIDFSKLGDMGLGGGMPGLEGLGGMGGEEDEDEEEDEDDDAPPGLEKVEDGKAKIEEVA